MTRIRSGRNKKLGPEIGVDSLKSPNGNSEDLGSNPSRSIKFKCPKCAAPMLSRVNRKYNLEFLGCSQWPHCKGSRNKDGSKGFTAHYVGMIGGDWDEERDHWLFGFERDDTW